MRQAIGRIRTKLKALPKAGASIPIGPTGSSSLAPWSDFAGVLDGDALWLAVVVPKDGDYDRLVLRWRGDRGLPDVPVPTRIEDCKGQTTLEACVALAGPASTT